MVDMSGLGSDGSIAVWVQVPPLVKKIAVVKT